MNQPKSGHLIFDKDANYAMGKRQFIQQMLLAKTGYSPTDEVRSVSLTLYKNQHMIKDRNLNPETETARGKHQEYTSRELGNNFLNITPTVQKLAPRINREDHIKFQSFCTAKRKLPG